MQENVLQASLLNFSHIFFRKLFSSSKSGWDFLTNVSFILSSCFYLPHGFFSCSALFLSSPSHLLLLSCPILCFCPPSLSQFFSFPPPNIRLFSKPLAATFFSCPSIWLPFLFSFPIPSPSFSFLFLLQPLLLLLLLLFFFSSLVGFVTCSCMRGAVEQVKLSGSGVFL